MNNQAGFISRVLTWALAGVVFVGGLFYSRHAHEGQALYPMRILGEQIEYALIPSEEGKISFRIDQLNDQAFEARKDVQNGDLETAKKRSQEILQKSDELKQRIDNLAQEGHDVADLKQNLKAVEQACAQITN
ncbi:MAG: hypothetical protein HYV13_02490 [Candidatus Doudnabacteria bacterium]|nr:hypothetical protein [Candidatus Doudnabacteria bacterium]